MILTARIARRRDEIEAQRALNHEMAGLIAYAMHDPKKLPKYKAMPAQGETPGLVSDPDDARVRAYFMALAGRSAR